LETAGLAYRPEFHAQAEHGSYEARVQAGRMLSLPERPTAIFCASDTQAMGALEAARELGMSVPQDLSVIGYDDIEIAEYLGLTTMRQLLFESGKRGVALLLGALEDPLREPVCHRLASELIIRSSSAPPA
jgi:DNA-binding LacI/PurR family transcriptional regulator